MKYVRGQRILLLGHKGPAWIHGMMVQHMPCYPCSMKAHPRAAVIVVRPLPAHPCQPWSSPCILPISWHQQAAPASTAPTSELHPGGEAPCTPATLHHIPCRPVCVPCVLLQGKTLGGVREAVAEYVSASDAAAMGEDAAEAARQRAHLHNLLKGIGHVVPSREPEPLDAAQPPATISAAVNAEAAAGASGGAEPRAGASWALLELIATYTCCYHQGITQSM